jgi:outer membrane protein OmpA-like peptidoglycan-associated protein
MRIPLRIIFLALTGMLVTLNVLAQHLAPVAALNSDLDEQAPVISPDGKLMFFTVADNPQNIGGIRDLGDIWYSRLEQNTWSAPVHAGKNINNTLHNTVAGFSADGTRLYLMGHYEQNGRPVKSQGISVSIIEGDTWSTPKNIVVPYFKNKTPYNSGQISSDGKILVFSGESYFTHGAEDIYVSLFNNGVWSEPKNLGKGVNTSMQDVSPSISADGKRLYFASNGRKGSGSFDIFFADRLDDTWQRWSAPANLGSPVNTDGRELFYRPSFHGDMYTSTKDSDGLGELHIIPSSETMMPDSSVVAVADSIDYNIEHDVTTEIINDLPKKDSVAKIIIAESDSVESGMTRLRGKVVNSKNGVIVAGASIRFHSIGDGTETTRVVVTDHQGEYANNLSSVNQYHVTVEALGYVGSFEKLDLRTQTMKDIELNFTVQPVEIGVSVNLKSVLFEQSKPVLLNESYDELDMVVDFMKFNPSVEIELRGHTDNRGLHDLNMKLSRERVNTVKAYIVSKGIDTRRISGKGFGGTRPIADNDVDETRALNRRVEFVIVKD